MELAIIVGNNSKVSYNLKLAKYIKNRYTGPLAIDIASINDLPMFGVDAIEEGIIPEEVKLFHNKIANVDGVIVVTPEYNHSIPAILKNTLDWMSYVYLPFRNKPVMIAGCAKGALGTVRAQTHLRTILDAPRVEANVLPGNEFLLTYAEDKFDASGTLIDQGTIDFLDQCFMNFIKFIVQNK